MVSTNKIIIDANTWLRFVIHGKQNKLINIIGKYKLKVFADNYLLSEIFDACVENDWYTTIQANQIIENIKLVVIGSTANAIYRFSPDPKDNYLFDLAIQNNCDFIVSDDKELRKMALQPKQIQTTNWFLKHFPV